MSDRLPPLTALRAFEAAARHLSFAKAAAELHVTPAALSFQIKNLEEHLGAPLFVRLNRAVALTEAGRALAPGATQGLDQLARAWRAARAVLDTSGLRVTAGPAFTAKWLAPRLYDFARAHPEIELRLMASLRNLDFDRDEVDVAIRYGTAQDPDLHSTALMSEAFLPMLRPDLAAADLTPERLARLPLIHDASTDFLTPTPDWPAWFAANGLPPPPAPVTHFSNADHALDAALAGGGAVLTRSSLALAYLADKRLVAPFAIALTTPARFRFMTTQAAAQRPQIRAFRDWLMQEIARYPDPLQGRQLVPTAAPPARAAGQSAT